MLPFLGWCPDRPGLEYGLEIVYSPISSLVTIWSDIPRGRMNWSMVIFWRISVAQFYDPFTPERPECGASLDPPTMCFWDGIFIRSGVAGEKQKWWSWRRNFTAWRSNVALLGQTDHQQYPFPFSPSPLSSHTRPPPPPPSSPLPTPDLKSDPNRPMSPDFPKFICRTRMPHFHQSSMSLLYLSLSRINVCLPLCHVRTAVEQPYTARSIVHVHFFSPPFLFLLVSCSVCVTENT